MLALGLGACSAGRSATDTGQTGPDAGEAGLELSDFEDFDPTPYAESPPETVTTIEHDVPDRLLRGQADQGVEQLVQGYRIQIFQTLDKEQAFLREEEVENWWASLSETERPRGLPDTLPVYVRYHQPYYRVRVGDFTSRSAAEAVLARLAKRFPGAFIAPDLVTVVR